MLLRTYEAVLADSLPEAVVRAAQRFTTGKVPKQSLTFSPSVAEFVVEVERQEENIELQARPRIPPPIYRPGPLAPFQIAQQKKLAENSHLPVLYENIGHDQWLKLSRTRQIPTGAKWVACLGIIYGPEPKRVQQAAE